MNPVAFSKESKTGWQCGVFEVPSVNNLWCWRTQLLAALSLEKVKKSDALIRELEHLMISKCERGD